MEQAERLLKLASSEEHHGKTSPERGFLSRSAIQAELFAELFEGIQATRGVIQIPQEALSHRAQGVADLPVRQDELDTRREILAGPRIIPIASQSLPEGLSDVATKEQDLVVQLGASSILVFP